MYKVDFNQPGRAYFMGIGGVSMSGLAEILVGEGFTVSGSDSNHSAVCDHLEELGVKINYSQVAENISGDIDFIVYTAAIHPDNGEYVAAQELGIPMLSRAQFLGQIMENYKYTIAVAGTHGKTTTTSMMAYTLLEAETDPTISIGGNLKVIDGNIKVGSSDYFVTEACEYTNSYHEFKPLISIILNIDNDHMDFFKTMDNVVKSFAKFASLTREGGAVIVNGDSPYIDSIKEAVADKNLTLITFGEGEDNDYRAVNVVLNDAGHPSYELYVKGVDSGDITLSVSGVHNAVNSLSVLAAADFLGLPRTACVEGLRKCSSADRRFQYKGTLAGDKVIIDDYAHHPTEIAATLKLAKAIKKADLWVAFQPHTYSRTLAHLDAFAEVLSVADHVLLADIYAAREKDDGSVSSKDIEERLIARGCDAHYLGDFESIKNYFEKNSMSSDMLITMGAGNIDNVGTMLLQG